MGTQKQKKSSKKKAAAIVTAGVLGLATAGGAYAYWTSAGGGSGTATTRDGASNIFGVTGGSTQAMFPGDSAQTVTATVTNNGTETYTVSAVKAYLTTDKTGCDGTDYKLNGSVAPTTAAGAVSLGLTAKDLAPAGTTTVDFTLQFNNKANANQNACQAATVTVHYIAS
ncbi:hypothetical protein [Terrabacter terrigena]|uniref:SipW-cognate class signal peptide n=1 Tax=Terrabacter terrigena TaxID=574718 RepID=A0ABW3MWE5_9MICO